MGFLIMAILFFILGIILLNNYILEKIDKEKYPQFVEILKIIPNLPLPKKDRWDSEEEHEQNVKNQQNIYTFSGILLWILTIILLLLQISSWVKALIGLFQ